MNKYFALEDGQFVVSGELLVFLQWLVQNEPDTLKKLVKRAMHEGLGVSIDKEQGSQHEDLDEAQSIIAEFFTVLDLLVTEVHTSWHAEREVPLVAGLTATADHVDSSVCDNEIVALSVSRTNKALKRNTRLNARETLYKELLKNWSPRDKNICH